MKTLVLGGYGNFGARICRALADDPHIDLLVGGRDPAKARRMAEALGGRAQGVAIDMNGEDLSGALRGLGAELVIHTAGPFQQQGYDVPLAVADAQAHYIDLADGRRYVCDFAQSVGPAFQRVQRTAISGASTVPALSSAVVDDLTRGWTHIESIDICIAPAQTAPRGEATLAAVLSYCGAPIQVWQQGAWVTRHGWADPQSVSFARLHPRLGALCDIPDLELLPRHYPTVQSVTFRAALELKVAQRALALLAQLRRMGLLTQPSRLAKFMNTVGGLFDSLGSSLGGMVVRVRGQDADGRAVQRAWHIAADHDHGPEIPCMAAIILARRIARDEPMPQAAQACLSMLTLDDFAPEFARWGMVCDTVEEA